MTINLTKVTIDVTREVKMKYNSGRFVKGKNAGKNHLNWKGGITRTDDGYILIHCPEHPTVQKRLKKYVREHILVSEKKLGRFLEKGEKVHHINGIRDDNRPENLIVIKSQAEHFKYHRKYKYYSNKSEIPEPKNIGEIIVLKTISKNKKIGYRYLETKKCISCENLIRRNIYIKTKDLCKKCMSSYLIKRNIVGYKK